MDEFHDRLALVTGAASGIGFALCRRFIALGMRVVAADIESAPLREATRSLGERAVGVHVDVSDAESVQNLADEVYSRWPTVHVLCNNAGVTVRTSLLEATREDWAWVLGVNLWGVIHGIEAFVPRMIEAREPGHVVNTCSMAAFLSAPRYGLYCASKHAVAAVSESLAGDLREVGAPIGVTAVCPGAVATNFVHAERTRPARYGGARPSATGAAEAVRIERERSAAQSADAVAEAAIEGVRANALFVFPDGDAKEPARERMQRILA